MDEMVRKVQQWVNLVYLNKPGLCKKSMKIGKNRVACD